VTSLPLKKSYFSSVVVVLAILLVFGLSLSKATTVMIDVDELFEIQQYVAQPLLDNLFTHFSVYGQFPHVLLTKIFSLIHWDILNLRLSSIVAGTLCVPLLYSLATYLFDARTGALSGLVLALTITHIHYATFVRSYSLMVMLSLLAIYCFSKAMRSEKQWWWVGFAVVAAINIYNHIFSFFLVAALFIFIVGWALRERRHLVSRHKSQLKNFVIAGGILFFLLLPIPVVILTSRNTVDGLSVLLANHQWPTSFPPLSVSQPANIIAPLVQMSYTFSPTRYPGWQTFLFLGFFFTGIIIGIKYTPFRWGTILLFAILFLPPFLMTIATTILGHWFYALRRFFLFIMPAYLVLSSLGIIFWVDFITQVLSRQRFLPARYIRPILMSSLIFLIIFPVIPYATYREHPPDPYAVARYVHAQAQPGDIVLCVPDEDWRVTARGANCSFIFKLYPELTDQVYFLDVLASYETLQRFLDSESDCRNHYVHMPRPRFQLDCTPVSKPSNPRGIWLILWRSRSTVVEAVQADSPNSLTQEMFDSTEVIYLENKTGLTNTLIDAGQIALSESKTPLRKFENYVSLANIYAAAENIEKTVSTLNEAAFVSRWPQAVERLTELQMQLSFLRIPFEPKEKVQVVWNNEIALVGIDQDLTNFQPTSGSTILISFYWELLQEVDTDYQVFLHLLDDQGSAQAIFDFQPFDGRRPFSDWPAEKTIRETRVFELPVDLSPGNYSLVVGLYKPGSLERLSIGSNLEQDGWTLTEWRVD